jgi:amino acid transporter
MRAALSVILGYLTMFVVVFATFTIAYLAMGTAGAFKPGTYEVSTTWLVVSFALGLVAAILGGLVCAGIARSSTPPKVLAAIVLVLGLILAIPSFTGGAEAPTTRPADVDNMTAMQNARTPPLVAVLNPLIGAVGVMIGASLRKQRTSSAPQV